MSEQLEEPARPLKPEELRLVLAQAVEMGDYDTANDAAERLATAETVLEAVNDTEL